jgi:hypothetical protein
MINPVKSYFSKKEQNPDQKELVELVKSNEKKAKIKFVNSMTGKKESDNKDLKKLKEKLKIIVDALKNGINDKSVLCSENVPNSTQSLNKKVVKYALDEIAKSENSAIAHIVLDDPQFGNLFSNDMNEEENACVKCIEKIQLCIESEITSEKKPIIIITEMKEQVKVIIIKANDSNQGELYFIDPFNCQQSINNQTKNNIFQQYLIRGSEKNHLKPLYQGDLNIASNLSNVESCKSEFETGWWCLFYCIMFLDTGNHLFLQDQNKSWSSDNFPRLKVLLTINLKTLSNFIYELDLNWAKNTQKSNTIDLKEFRQNDFEIKNDFITHSEKIKQRIESLQKESLSEQIKNFENEEKVLNLKNNKIKKEIQDLEQLIKQSTSVLSTEIQDKSVITIEAKFKRFIFGDERLLIEKKLKKKEEKSMKIFLSNNDTIRRHNIEEKIKELEGLIKADESTLVELKKKIDERVVERKHTEDKIKNKINKIKKFESNIQSAVTNSEILKSRLEDLAKVIREVDVFVEKNPDEFIERVLKDDVSYEDKQKIKKTNSTLNEIKLNLGKLTADLKKNENEKDDFIKKKSELQIQIDLEKTKIAESNGKIGSLKSRVSNTKNALNGLWFWQWSAKSEYQNNLNYLENRLSNERGNLISLNKTVRDYESDIKNIENYINRFKAKDVRIKSLIEIQISQKDSEIESLKNEKDQILNKLIRDKTICDEKLFSNQKDLKANEVDIKHKKKQLTNENVRLKSLNEEIEHVVLLKSIYVQKISDWNTKIMNLKEGINKIVDIFIFRYLFYFLNVFPIL